METLEVSASTIITVWSLVIFHEVLQSISFEGKKKNQNKNPKKTNTAQQMH